MVIKIRDAELEEIRKSYNVLEDRVQYFKNLVEYLKGEGQRKNKWITILAVTLGLVAAGIVALQIYDLTHPDRGWYQTAAQWFASMGVRI